MSRCFLVLSFLLVFYCGTVNASVCSEVEVIEGQEKYNEFVCVGINYFNIGLYGRAIEEYKKALKIKFYEFPNYKLNARVAHAYLLLGDIDKAVHYSERSEITLSLLSDVYSCEEDENQIPFISKDGKKPLSSPLGREVAEEMCGDAYAYIYNSRFKKPSAMILEGELAKYHELVAKLIKERKSHDSGSSEP